MRSIILPIIFLMNSTLGLANQDELIKVGDTVPEFSFEKSPGQFEEFTDFSYKKVVVLVFFATWCAPCNNELPHLNNTILPEYAGNKDFEMMIFGREHQWSELEKFKQEKQFDLSFYADPKREVYSKFASKYIPRTFVVDKSGKIIFAHIGFDVKVIEKLKKTINKALKN